MTKSDECQRARLKEYLLSSSRTPWRISRDKFGSDTARERLSAPSRALRISKARPRLSERWLDGKRALKNARLRLTRSVYRARADLLPRVMSPSNAPIAQPVPAAGVTPLEHTILSGGYPRAKAPL